MARYLKRLDPLGYFVPGQPIDKRVINSGQDGGKKHSVGSILGSLKLVPDAGMDL